MTDTLVTPRTVTLAPTDLFEAACVALENETVQQCRGVLRKQTADGSVMHCAEGVIAQVLMNAYPGRYGWTGDGALLDLVDEERMTMLRPADWNRLHPRGNAIATFTAAGFFRASIAGVNDIDVLPFSLIASELRLARLTVASWEAR